MHSLNPSPAALGADGVPITSPDESVSWISSELVRCTAEPFPLTRRR